VKTGYQGVPGANSEEALARAVPDAEPVPCRTLALLFAALVAGEIERAFVPVENSHAGSVVEAYDLMVSNPVTVLGEWIHPVRHYLLGVPGATLETVTRVYSHPQALSQSDAFLHTHGIAPEPFYDTAGAAQMVAERGDPTVAAVASRLAGNRYNLETLAEDVQTASDNATRFFLLAPGEWAPDRTVSSDAPGKTSLVFATDHTPGALVRALGCFSRRQVNIARLESRPSRRRPWEYLFLADLEGYERDPDMHAALRELHRLEPFVRVFGSYPAAGTPSPT
jgi:prephenate dehydratase